MTSPRPLRSLLRKNAATLNARRSRCTRASAPGRTAARQPHTQRTLESARRPPQAWTDLKPACPCSNRSRMASFGYVLRVGRAHAPRGCPGGSASSSLVPTTRAPPTIVVRERRSMDAAPTLPAETRMCRSTLVLSQVRRVGAAHDHLSALWSNGQPPKRSGKGETTGGFVRRLAGGRLARRAFGSPPGPSRR